MFLNVGVSQTHIQCSLVNAHSKCNQLIHILNMSCGCILRNTLEV